MPPGFFNRIDPKRTARSRLLSLVGRTFRPLQGLRGPSECRRRRRRVGDHGGEERLRRRMTAWSGLLSGTLRRPIGMRSSRVDGGPTWESNIGRLRNSFDNVQRAAGRHCGSSPNFSELPQSGSKTMHDALLCAAA